MLEDLIHELLIKRGWNVAPKMTVYNSAAAINDLDSGDVILLCGGPYLSKRNKLESGFGMMSGDSNPAGHRHPVVGVKGVEDNLIQAQI
jgi:hypothetical protein